MIQDASHLFLSTIIINHQAFPSLPRVAEEEEEGLERAKSSWRNTEQMEKDRESN